MIARRTSSARSDKTKELESLKASRKRAQRRESIRQQTVEDSEESEPSLEEDDIDEVDDQIAWHIIIDQLGQCLILSCVCSAAVGHPG